MNDEELRAHIDHDLLVRGGAPRLRGSRVTVFDVVARLHFGDTARDLLDDYPDLTHEDIRAVLFYCRTKRCARERLFCDGCTLYRENSDDTFEDFLRKAGRVQTVKDGGPIDLNKGGYVYLGSMDGLRRDWEGYPGWEWAEELEPEVEAELRTLEADRT